MTDNERKLAVDEAAIAHHLLDAANALEHLRVDMARDGTSAGTRARAKIVHTELQKALALLRDDKP
jgi:hypothetical protein